MKKIWDWIKSLFEKNDWECGWDDGFWGLIPQSPNNKYYMDGYEAGAEESARGLI